MSFMITLCLQFSQLLKEVLPIERECFNTYSEQRAVRDVRLLAKRLTHNTIIVSSTVYSLIPSIHILKTELDL